MSRKIRIKRMWNSNWEITADRPQQTLAENLSRQEALAKISEYFNNGAKEVIIHTERNIL
jgi:adenosine deaminase